MVKSKHLSDLMNKASKLTADLDGIQIKMHNTGYIIA